MVSKLSDISVLVTKASGIKVPFDPEKLGRSLRKAGADNETASHIIAETEKQLYSEISTKEIYKIAFSILKKKARPVAAKYKLKKAIQELGPSGYPFEKYVGEILKCEGFDVQVGKVVNGHCVSHEIDVIAQKDDKHFMIECKFHNKPGNMCNVKVPLYIHSRFLDVEKKWQLQPGHGTFFHQGWIVTNTRFTSDALTYGLCSGLNLVGWDFPENESLKDRINHSGLHPITCLTTLAKSEKQFLLDAGVVLCRDLCEHPELLHEHFHISDRQSQKVLKEAKEVCTTTIIN
ncbi:MAG: ATP cone domain-containing protein [Bacteroidia bacterium]